jgi:hypothetical protein
MLKLVGTAAVVGTAGFLARAENAGAVVAILITNLLNGVLVDVDVRDNNLAVQLCAVIEAVDIKQ